MNVSFGKQKKNNRWCTLFAGIICLILSAISFYIVFFGAQLDGGIPFIPETANQLIGKTTFFGGAVFTGLLAFLAFREFSNLKNKKSVHTN